MRGLKLMLPVSSMQLRCAGAFCNSNHGVGIAGTRSVAKIDDLDQTSRSSGGAGPH
jgi:hypothetical protein